MDTVEQMGTDEQYVTCAECGKETDLWVKRGEKRKCIKCAGLLGSRIKIIEGPPDSEPPESRESVSALPKSGESVEE